jgi:hypothetical protein
VVGRALPGGAPVPFRERAEETFLLASLLPFGVTHPAFGSLVRQNYPDMSDIPVEAVTVMMFSVMLLVGLTR